MPKRPTEPTKSLADYLPSIFGPYPPEPGDWLTQVSLSTKIIGIDNKPGLFLASRRFWKFVELADDPNGGGLCYLAHPVEAVPMRTISTPISYLDPGAYRKATEEEIAQALAERIQNIKPYFEADNVLVSINGHTFRADNVRIMPR